MTKGALGMAVRVINELALDSARSNVKVKIVVIANGSLGYDAVVFSVEKDTCVRYKNVRPTYSGRIFKHTTPVPRDRMR